MTKHIDETDPFHEQTSPQPLRICCYGSSSKLTPDKYLDESYSLGYTLAKRGHTCVNGAGRNGCMGSLNEGVLDGNGHVVGVIHEMFVVDGSDWLVGSHNIFSSSSHPVFDSDAKNNTMDSQNKNENTGNKRPIRELLLAGGNDLQQRKKMLVDGAEAIIVLPGGAGTFDELWEMACARNLGLVDCPIVCVNVDGFYDPFQIMLQRVYDDKLLYIAPSDLIHFEPTSIKAVQWVEKKIKTDRENPEHVKNQKKNIKLRRKKSILERTMSMFSPSISLQDVQVKYGDDHHNVGYVPLIISFFAGIALGTTLSSNCRK